MIQYDNGYFGLALTTQDIIDGIVDGKFSNRYLAQAFFSLPNLGTLEQMNTFEEFKYNVEAYVDGLISVPVPNFGAVDPKSEDAEGTMTEAYLPYPDDEVLLGWYEHYKEHYLDDEDEDEDEDE